MSSLSNSLEILFNKMEGFISSKTVIGEPIHIGDVIVVPLVDISVGVGAGASEKKEANLENTGGGVGAKMSPSAMLVIQNGSVQLVDIKNQNSVNKVIDMVPGIVSKLNLGSFFGSEDEETETEEELKDVNKKD